MAFFIYSQNNSGGGFDIRPNSGISEYVIVEADSASQADERAESIGIYFDPYYQYDCECCGTRWSEAYGEGSPEPTIYGVSLDEYVPMINFTGDAPHAFVHYADGRVESFGGSK